MDSVFKRRSLGSQHRPEPAVSTPQRWVCKGQGLCWMRRWSNWERIDGEVWLFDSYDMLMLSVGLPECFSLQQLSVPVSAISRVACVWIDQWIPRAKGENDWACTLPTAVQRGWDERWTCSYCTGTCCFLSLERQRTESRKRFNCKSLWVCILHPTPTFDLRE